MRYRTTQFGLLTLLCVLSLTAAAQLENVKITTTKITDSIYMLQGRGGNIGVSIGADGVFLVDDQFAPLTQKISAAVAALSDKPIKFVVNTHWHGDHTGGNENLGKQGVTIVAHDNVRKRMSTDQVLKAFNRPVPASPDGALPVITFNRAMTFYFNEEEIKVEHYPYSHTDGDSILFFKNLGKIVMGHFSTEQVARYHTGYFASSRQHGIGERSHKANSGATINEP
ncbi:MAG: MBL fold metallo-hydrolase [Pseudomonadota bacterium]